MEKSNYLLGCDVLGDDIFSAAASADTPPPSMSVYLPGGQAAKAGYPATRMNAATAQKIYASKQKLAATQAALKALQTQQAAAVAAQVAALAAQNAAATPAAPTATSTDPNAAPAATDPIAAAAAATTAVSTTDDGSDASTVAAGLEELLGATMPSAGPFVTIHVKNVPQLVATQGGAMGALAQKLVPQTIENKVYSEMAAKIASGMKDQGVDADVQVVMNAPLGGPMTQDFTVGALIGAGGAGIVYGVVKLAQHFLSGKGSKKS